jgi:hypothetical protein
MDELTACILSAVRCDVTKSSLDKWLLIDAYCEMLPPPSADSERVGAGIFLPPGDIAKVENS